MKRRIAIVVQGRFHAFDLARTLIARGHDVTVFTNYPGWAADRFGVPRSAVRSFVGHGLLSRSAGALARVGLPARAEQPLHMLFGRWAAGEIARGEWDVIHCWSGVSEELLRGQRPGGGVTLLMRGSAHIEAQAALLADEAVRAGVVTEAPSEWMRQREAREYALADHIVVLSTFARQTFLDRGTPPDRVSVVPLGADVSSFRPDAGVIERRCQRIANGEPLRVLYTGALSFQKGWLDLVAVARRLQDQPFRFVCVGPVTDEVRPTLSGLPSTLELPGKRAQRDLPAVYAEADLFLFPTIQDGFGMVLAQARAGGLPVLTTTNSAGPDLVREGVDGWVVPIRRPDMLEERLRWCVRNRGALVEMVRAAYTSAPVWDWRDVAEAFETLCEKLLRTAHRVAL